MPQPTPYGWRSKPQPFKPQSSRPQPSRPQPSNPQSTKPAPDHRHEYADEPFKTAYSDMILRSSDGVQLRVHKAILAMNSEKWEDAIKSMETESPRDNKGRILTELTEDSATLILLLRTIYPSDPGTAPPPLESAGAPQTFAVLAAARKYGMHDATKLAKAAIARLADARPLRVYALAAVRGWEHEMHAAAQASLAHPLHELFLYTEELVQIRADVYRSLLAYRHQGEQAAVGALADLKWIGRIAAEEGWKPCWGTCENRACREAPNMPSAWFRVYVDAVAQALHVRPSKKTLEDPALVDVAVGGADACDSCRRNAHHDIKKFNHLLGSEIEQRIEHIQLQIR